MNELIYLVGGDNINSILSCNPRTGERKYVGVSLKSLEHAKIQAFIIDTKKCIDPKNILEYYSTNNI